MYQNIICHALLQELQGKCSELRLSTQSLQHDLETKVTELTLTRGA